MNFSVFSKSATRRRAAALRPRGRGASRRGLRARSEPAPHLPLLARVRARASGRDSSTAIAPTARSSPGAGCASTPASCCSTPTRRAVAVPDGLRPRGRRARPGDNTGAAMKSVVVDPRATTGRGTCRSGAPRRETVDLRAARPRLHARTRAPASPRARRGTYAGLIEKIPYLQRARRHGRGAAAGLPVRPAGRPRGPRQLLGLLAGRLLRAAPGLRSRRDPLGGARRVPRHGQGAPPRRHRGDPRRRLQPHRRGRRARPHALLPRPRQRRLLPARRRTGPLRELQPAAATRSTPTTRSCGG